MNFTLETTSSDGYGIFGKLFKEDGTFFCYTLEHAFAKEDGGYAPVIPRGQTYVCSRRLSPKFGYDVFELVNVPGHDFIEIHVGNYNSDTDGCILLGKEQMVYGILDSRVTFLDFMSLQGGLTEFTLTVK